jgi:hypothetical protein
VDLGELATVVVDQTRPMEVVMQEGLLREEVGVECVGEAGVE